MLSFPFAKINLGLNVVRKRADGYHDIESIMVPIPLHDVLEIISDDALARNEIVYTRSGQFIPGEPQVDLVVRAIRSLQKDRELPGLRVHLHKVIPMGAGLGGGSSDAAHALVLTDQLLHLGTSSEHLGRIAAELGSDCAFFLREKVQLALGRGEILSPLSLDFSGKHVLLVNPGIHVSTAEAYRNLAPTGSLMDLGVRVQRPVAEWRELLPNTMEPSVFEHHPAIAAIKAKLYASGAAFASMSGSGSTVYGIFEEQAPEITWPVDHQVWSLTWT
jgi:4-diphosphocytidyl-2-C-methyl-D-erythritol kinase